ncbi:hypothetical protein B9Z55_007857 [Caenorhabditis nigoni]|uniref:Uncharacterized protein n=1 Tax=Caenorhabditis nigoni TaxID=1611254 RepID=A0A2G5VBK8_9PELO|nr:hypothetical protein B9Z55_007857 [Caenorhabditis nigoni]
MPTLPTDSQALIRTTQSISIQRINNGEFILGPRISFDKVLHPYNEPYRNDFCTAQNQEIKKCDSSC